MEWWKWIIITLFPYLLGTIHFGKVITKIRKKADITKTQSGNPGTMNMLRNHGFGMAIATLFFDGLKGASSALLGYGLFGGFAGTDPVPAIAFTGLYLAGLCSMLGHNFPFYKKFKGGKGVACAFGMFMVANPLWTGVTFAIAFAYLYIFENTGFGSVCSFLFITILTVVEALRHSGSLPISFLLFTIYFITFFQHRSNIFRLLVGKENKANLRKHVKKFFSRKNRKAKKEEDKQREIG